ncbi:MAG: transglutaminaseTgpA domain-containing protein, partial [Planctomycetes bacterium]|nr:transglutaminaseTgpA domain-containing protein [Planctomycetota bacterium]
VGAARAEDPDPTDYTKDTEEGAFRITGFSARVRLGDVGRIKQAPWPAFVVQITEGGRPTPVSPAHLYFRGRTLQVFDGREWSSGEPEPEPTGLLELPSRLHVQDARGAARLLVQEYVLRPSSSDVIFALDTPCWLELDRALPRVIARADGTFRAPSAPGEGLVYRAGSRLPSAGHRGLAAWPPPSAACLALPPVSERLVSAAGSAAGSGDPESRGRRIAEWVRSRCEYTLAFTGDPEGSPVEDFLFGTMAGHCEYFAAATAVLLRAAGLPSRLVVGYRGGLWLADEEAYLLRQSDAHAWVESWVDGRGWMRLDATPADDRAVRVPPSRLPGAAPETTRPSVDLVALVRRFGPEDRARVLRGLSGAAAFALREGIGVGRPRRHFPPPVPALGVLLVALLSARWLLRRARLRAGGALREKRAIPPSEDFYREALRRLRRRGLPRSTSLTPREFEEGVRSRLGEDGPVFRDITMAFEETRYGGRPLAKETGRLLRRKCRTLGGARRAQPDAAD